MVEPGLRAPSSMDDIVRGLAVRELARQANDDFTAKQSLARLDKIIKRDQHKT